MSVTGSIKLNISAGLASVFVALTLVLLKLWALGQTGSLSVAASLTDSSLDLMVSLVAFVAILYAARPADEDHAFGHSSVEDLAALGQSVFIAASGCVIAWAAVARLLSPTPSRLTSEGSGMAIMGASVALTIALVLWQRHVATRTGSRVVRADSLHYMGDLLPNVGAILSLWASSRFGLTQIDNIVALGAASILIFGSARIFLAAWHALMDRAADPALIEGIAEITRNWPEVRGFHDLKTRTAGAVVFVNLHIELDGDQTLQQAHAIGASLRRAILKAYPQTDVIIHKDVAR
ncbi:cation diffusion facilitator family transporter [Pseudogemmobacter sp. W21_MBD1_M6]|uniref:cation diffusion facilitator family transporter n=1 Tax=Pseudogemmobacter sp. W21_MBD1_M6 TaxID=3240271 RepID=UPI003F9C2FBF